jgi:hypothetical protein
LIENEKRIAAGVELCPSPKFSIKPSKAKQRLGSAGSDDFITNTSEKGSMM